VLWLCLHFPRLPLSALDAEVQQGVVVDQRGSQRWLITAGPDCPAGTPLPRALSLHPELKVWTRRPSAEQAALHSLACWAYRFGQPVTAEIQDLQEPGRSPRTLLWIEIGSSLALFGGLDALRERLCSELVELGHAAQLGIAPTRSGAALLACVGHFGPVHDASSLERILGALPLSALHWPSDVLRALSGVGFRHLSDLFVVPRDAFSKRFGAGYRLELDRLLGQAPEPCEAIVPPETFRRRFELSAEIEEVERLQFPLKRLCTELQAYLRARDRGLRSVILRVAHADARETCIHARFVDPHRDARRTFDALRERLERDGLPLPARELVLVAEDFAEASVPQDDLFDARAGRAQAWSAAIERIRGRLGDANVWMPRTVEDHRPERAMEQGSEPAFPQRIVSSFFATPPRPSLLYREPWIMPPPPEHADFERIEAGWWDGDDVRRDYMILDINGARAWGFHDLISGNWYLQGWFS
jgi:protein ImuB